MPEATCCCAQTTPPLPRASSGTPVRSAAAQWRRVGRVKAPVSFSAT